MEDRPIPTTRSNHRAVGFRYTAGAMLIGIGLAVVFIVTTQISKRQAGPTLHGQVYDQNHFPIAAVKVEVWTGDPGWRKAYETVTDEQGRYALSSVHGAKNWPKGNQAYNLLRINLAHPTCEPVSQIVNVPDIDRLRFKQDFLMDRATVEVGEEQAERR